MPQCENCKNLCFNRHMFKGRWICLDCYKIGIKNRDELYFKALREATRIK